MASPLTNRPFDMKWTTLVFTTHNINFFKFHIAFDFPVWFPKTAYWGNFWLWPELKTHKYWNRTTCFFHQTRSRRCWQDSKNYLGWFPTSFQRKQINTIQMPKHLDFHLHKTHIETSQILSVTQSSTQYIWKPESKIEYA